MYLIATLKSCEQYRYDQHSGQWFTFFKKEQNHSGTPIFLPGTVSRSWACWQVMPQLCEQHFSVPEHSESLRQALMHAESNTDSDVLFGQKPGFTKSAARQLSTHWNGERDIEYEIYFTPRVTCIQWHFHFPKWYTASLFCSFTAIIISKK